LSAGGPRPEAAASASESVRDQGGASPLRANVLRPVTESNCVAARRGGEQQEVNDQSATRMSVMLIKVNSIRPDVGGEPASQWRSPDPSEKDGEPRKLKGNVTKRSRGASGVWRRNGRKVSYVNQRDLSRAAKVFKRP